MDDLEVIRFTIKPLLLAGKYFITTTGKKVKCQMLCINEQDNQIQGVTACAIDWDSKVLYIDPEIFVHQSAKFVYDYQI